MRREGEDGVGRGRRSECVVIHIPDSSLPFPLSPPCTHHFVCDILDVFQPQFLADDIQVSHRVHIPLYVGHIIILKRPWRNHKAETQIPSSPNLQRYTTRDHVTIKISVHRRICIGECCASWLQVCLHTILYRRQMMPLREEEDGNKHGHFAVYAAQTQ